jgi:hypothetical protein
MSELPTGTVTFLFTDIEGSTALLKRFGERYGAVLADHQRIIRNAVRSALGALGSRPRKLSSVKAASWFPVSGVLVKTSRKLDTRRVNGVGCARGLGPSESG